MTYTAGSRIESSDYNTFVSDVNNLWGTGSGNKGYGQSSTVGTVAGGGQVTATQWSTLASRVNSIRPEVVLDLLTNLVVPVLIFLLGNEYMPLETWQHN